MENNKPKNVIVVGYSCTLKCGAEVTVVEVGDNYYVVVEDQYENQKKVSKYRLMRGEIYWNFPEYKEDKPLKPVNWSATGTPYGAKNLADGQRILTRTSGYCVVLLAGRSKSNIRFEDTGTVKEGVSSCHLKRGRVEDPNRKTLGDRVTVGFTRSTKKYGEFCVVEDLGANVKLHWKCSNTFQVESKIDVIYCRIKDCNYIPKPSPVKFVKEVELKLDRNYVYIAKCENEIVYIGQGKGDRWKHCIGGKSHCYGLNALHFQGSVVTVEILKDGMSKQEAMELEYQLIKEFSPVHNTYGVISGPVGELLQNCEQNL